MAVRSIHHVNICANAVQVAQLRRFCCKVLGLSESWRLPFASRGVRRLAGDLPVLHLIATAARR